MIVLGELGGKDVVDRDALDAVIQIERDLSTSRSRALSPPGVGRTGGAVAVQPLVLDTVNLGQAFLVPAPHRADPVAHLPFQGADTGSKFITARNLSRAFIPQPPCLLIFLAEALPGAVAAILTLI